MAAILKYVILVNILFIFNVFTGFAAQPALLKNNSDSKPMSNNLSPKDMFEESIILHKAGRTDSAIVLLKRATEIDDKFAEAYNKLALLYVEKGTVYSRELAEKALEKAIEINPDKLEYKINYGKLMIKQGFRYNARRKFNFVTDLDSTNTEAYLQLGILYKQEMEFFKNMFSGNIVGFMDDNLYTYAGLGYGDSRSDGNYGLTQGFVGKNEEERAKQIDFSRFSREDYKKALDAFSKVIELKPNNRDGLHNLSLLALEEDEYDEFINYQKKILEYFPDNKDAHLYLGYGYHKKRKDELAYAEYEKARKLMSGSEEFAFERIEHILPPDDLEKYKKMTPTTQMLSRERFWESKDPLFLTEYNERKLEHYNRVAYANLKYGVEKKDIPGWRTDRGKIYIRYGAPKKLVRLRPEMLAQSAVLELAEIWYYDRFTFVFEDPYRTGNFKLGGRSRFRNVDINFRELADYVYERMPDLYVPEFEGNTFAFDYYTASFRKDGELSLLEVYYAIPVNELGFKKNADTKTASVDKGIFFFDNNWSVMTQEKGKENISVKADIDTTNLYYIGKYQLDMMPGKYNVSIEFQEESFKNTGSARDIVGIDTFLFGDLNLSDIVLAHNIGISKKKSKFTRGDLEIIPNPKKVFSKNQPVHIYFEVYNLIVSPEQKTKYIIEYKVSSLTKEKKSFVKGLFSNIGKLFGKKAEIRDIITSYEYEGTSPIENVNFSVDMSGTQTGFYELTINVRDLNSSKEISKDIKFILDKSKINYLF